MLPLLTYECDEGFGDIRRKRTRSHRRGVRRKDEPGRDLRPAAGDPVAFHGRAREISAAAEDLDRWFARSGERLHAYRAGERARGGADIAEKDGAVVFAAAEPAC